MLEFFNPPAAKPRLAADKIDGEYRRMRLKVFLGAFFGYAAYYLVRKNLSLAAPDMIRDGLLDKETAGFAMAGIPIAYAFSKFLMGSLSDRSDARKFLVVERLKECPNTLIRFLGVSGIKYKVEPEAAAVP